VRVGRPQKRRSDPKKPLAKALPLVAVLIGAGLRMTRKRKATRRAEDGLVNDGMVAAPGLEPTSAAPPVDATPEPIEAVLSVVAPIDVVAEHSPAPARRTTATSVLEVLATGGAMTAGEVALATGLSRSAISSTLSRLTRAGEVGKAERGYELVSTPRPKPSQLRARTRAADEPVVGNAAARKARGQTKAAVLAALSGDRALTSGDVATATGLSRSAVSTTLSRLAKTGEVVKAERGYLIPPATA
jgi:DNA-binding transcriptional ArsR family regulator